MKVTQYSNHSDGRLDLKLNRIKALPEDFGKLRRLKVVDLSSNSLEVLPTSILDLKRLMTLKLLNNNELICPRQETLNSDIKVIFWEIHHKMMWYVLSEHLSIIQPMYAHRS
jgi:Leucine-rich repeat (LRR) protein